MNSLIVRCFLLFVASILSAQARSQAFWIGLNSENKTELELKTKDFCQTFGCSYIGVSSWLQAGCIECQIEPPVCYPGVEWIQKLGMYTSRQNALQLDSLGINGHAKLQLSMLGLDSFHKAGYTGAGVRVALFDAGFQRFDSLKPFTEMRENNRLIAFYDFVDGDTSVFDAHPHGMQVLSIAGINYPDSLIGAAPGAQFLLARTEDANSETHLEEFNWVSALEWADSIGVDIIHSSLGYSVFDSLQGDYQYADMDGKTTIITRAAEMAFERGIFITNSAGNEGAKEWFHITAPCDGPNVLCVGAVDSFEQIADFSGKGPTADGRVKPDVLAMGHRTSFLNTDGFIRTGSGTSFSGPLVAGMVACLKQKWPDVPNDRLLRAIRMSGDRYQKPDSAYGFGLVNVWRVDSLLTQMLHAPLVQSSATVRLFPNPVKGELQLESQWPVQHIRLYDASGKLVLEQAGEHITTVDLGEMAGGIYTMSIVTPNRMTLHRRLIILP